MDIVCLQGFCLPADYEEEADGEGSTQFEDIEGGGLGEGEGAKDVSDQIESEDQVSTLGLFSWSPCIVLQLTLEALK